MIDVRPTLSSALGMRHRAALGITEESDAVAIIVSEETGKISYVKDGELFNNRTAQQLEQFLSVQVDFAKKLSTYNYPLSLLKMM